MRSLVDEAVAAEWLPTVFNGLKKGGSLRDVPTCRGAGSLSRKYPIARTVRLHRHLQGNQQRNEPEVAVVYRGRTTQTLSHI